jgi:hypothetical protein
MKKLKSGAFTTTLDLEPGREYQFRYLLDEKIWGNERDADKSVPTPYGDSENSIIGYLIHRFRRLHGLHETLEGCREIPKA